MTKIIKLFFFIIILLSFVGCQMSQLSYENNELGLQVDDNHISAKGTTLYHHTDNYANLFLSQRVLRLNNGSIVTYEEARTDSLYEFNLVPRLTIKAVFEAREVRQVYFKSSFYLIQLILKDGSVLNIAAEQFDDQRLAYVYGISTGELRKLLKKLGANEPYPLIENVRTLRNDQSALLSKWNTKKINFIPLVEPVRYIFGI